MRAVLRERELAIADLKHVGIVPVAGAGVTLQTGLVAGDRVNAVPIRSDVARRPPQVAANRWSPLPHRVPSVLAKREDDGPSGRLESLVHLGVGSLHQPHLRGLVAG